MRGFLIFFNLAGAILSIALLVSTFAAKGIITSQAQRIAVEKSRKYSDPLAGKLQETLDRPLIGKLIVGKPREVLERELQDYRSSPGDWLEELARGGADKAKQIDFPEITQPLARKALDALKSEMTGLKAQVQDSYRNLIADLRLFATTNLIVFLLIAWLCWIARSPSAIHWLVGYSLAMSLALVISIYFYAQQNWAWSILRNDYMGWRYPSLLGIATAYLMLRFTPEIAFQYDWKKKEPLP
ncbi:hypothetical protein [Haloferula sp. BvORR071]|uniref:hypothetical protein n=1 Tax=Haloferula sp. BvORR071 TaxID=1396141 RepID=UPI000556B726|nr:hypothetical protein [Haloferula sp. BvORR071]